jgi:hypothetical protein
VTRIVVVAAGALLAAGLFLALRPAGEEEATTETTPTATATVTETAPAPQEPKPEVPTLRVLVRDGALVRRIQRLRVERGARVRIVVRADVRDHVHLHGYDVMRDVGPGQPARFRFRATLTGRFEIELEDRHVLIAELEVRP